MTAARKTLELKQRKQRALARQRAEVQAELDREAYEAKVAADWMRFVAIRFPNHYRPPQ